MSTPKSIHALIHYKLRALHESGCCCMLHTFLMMIEQQNSGGEARALGWGHGEMTGY